MSMGYKDPLRRFGATDLVYPVGPPIFTPLVASTLGNVATPADGFDAKIAPLYAALGVDTGAGANLDSDLMGAAFTPGQIQAAAIDPLTIDVANAEQIVGDASGAVDTQVNTELNADSPPSTPLTPNPGGPLAGTPQDPCQNLTGIQRQSCEENQGSQGPGSVPVPTQPGQPTAPSFGPKPILPFGPGRGFNPGGN